MLVGCWALTHFSTGLGSVGVWENCVICSISLVHVFSFQLTHCFTNITISILVIFCNAFLINWHVFFTIIFPFFGNTFVYCFWVGVLLEKTSLPPCGSGKTKIGVHSTLPRHHLWDNTRYVCCLLFVVLNCLLLDLVCADYPVIGCINRAVEHEQIYFPFPLLFITSIQALKFYRMDLIMPSDSFLITTHFHLGNDWWVIWCCFLLIFRSSTHSVISSQGS